MLRGIDEILDALAAQHAELASMLAGLDDEGWSQASRCEGWAVSDVVLHLAQTDEMALASLEGRFAEHLDEVAAVWASATNVDDGAGLLVAAERGVPAEAIHQRWLAGTAALRAALGDRAPGDRVTWVAGELTIRTLATTRLAECWIHSGDVAHALGVELEPSDRLHHIARLAWRTVPYAFARDGRELHGAVAFDLAGPAGEQWRFDPPDGDAATTVHGPALDLCLVAGQRAPASDTALTADGPDADAVLELVRTFA